MSVPLVLSQTHDMPDFQLGEVWKNPISELCLQGGILQYTFRGSQEAVTPWGPDGKPVFSSVQTVSLGDPFSMSGTSLAFGSILVRTIAGEASAFRLMKRSLPRTVFILDTTT